MSVFKSDVVKKLQGKSTDIVSVFTKTVNKLLEVNNEIESEKKSRLEKITKAQTEHDALHVQQEQNAEIISKINKLIN
jgi:hypothetical protein